MKNWLIRIWWNIEWFFFWKWKWPWSMASIKRKLKADFGRESEYTHERLKNMPRRNWKPPNPALIERINQIYRDDPDPS